MTHTNRQSVFLRLYFIHLFVLQDPHFVKDAQEYSSERIQTDGFVKWVSLDEFEQDSFYNICLPKVIRQPEGNCSNSIKQRRVFTL